MFHMPKSMAGTRAMTTMIMARFKSMASRTWQPLFVTRLGVKAKVSKASKVL